MAQIQCYHCKHTWPLAEAASNRCPKCGWITEVYFSEEDALRVAQIYNEQAPVLPEPSGVMPLIGINGFAVAFPDQGRLAEVAGLLLDAEAK